MMKWTDRLIIGMISLMSLFFCILAFDDLLMIVKGFLFTEVLIIAGYMDIKTRTIPDWIHVLIILIGLIQVDIISSILGLILVPIPFLIMALVKEGSIGGGDIKLMGACGFFLGLTDGLIGSIIGLIIAVVVNGIHCKTTKTNKNISFPLGPYLGFGSFLMIIITNVR